MSFITSVFKGVIDSLRGVHVLINLDNEIKETSRKSPHKSATSRDSKDEKVKEQPKVLTRVLQSCILNGFIFLLSILLFEYPMLLSFNFIVTQFFGNDPDLKNYIWDWLHLLLSSTFKMVWVLPLFLLSKVVNSLWFQEIANSAYLHRRGRPQYMSSFSKMFADSCFSAYVEVLFLVQSMLVSMVPYVGDILYLLHLSLLYSLYSFEYKWFNMGWELHKRLLFIEANWPYFLGFGLPLAILTTLSSSYVISGCLFAVFFPVFILSGNEASPIIGRELPLRLFSPVVSISNVLFRRNDPPKVEQKSS